MKKAWILACVLCLLCSNSLAAGNVPNNQTVISTTVSEGYTVTIPAALPVAYGATRTDLTIEVSNIKLFAGNSVHITPENYNAKLKNAANDEINYQLLNGNTEWSTSNPLTFSENGSKALELTISTDEWNSAPAGNYSDTVTFTVSIVTSN